MDERPILVIGAPRSGTTWIGEALALAPGTCSIHEPDNEVAVPFAATAKLSLGRFPTLGASDDAPLPYEELWHAALSGRVQSHSLRWYAAKSLLKTARRSELRAAFCNGSGPRISTRLRAVSALAARPSWRQLNGRPIVKSVNACLALDWLAQRWDPRVVVVRRHPFNVVASWLELGWEPCGLDGHGPLHDRYVHASSTAPQPPAAGLVGRIAWQIGLFMNALQAVAQGRRDWLVVSHDELCADPHSRFRAMCEELGLPWRDAIETFLDKSNRPGTGTATHRIASEQPERWRRRLNDEQIREARAALAGFAPGSWANQLVLG